jgi:TRAP transporter 4TM/12TM fusion protein
VTDVSLPETDGAVRDLGAGKPAFTILCAVIAVGHIYAATIGAFAENWVSALHFGAFGLVCALTIPLATARGARKSIIFGVDLILGVLAVACALYLIGAEEELYERGVRFNTTDWFFSVTAVILAIEFTRRTTGWIAPFLIIASLSYMVVWGPMIGGVFGFAGLSWETALYRSYFGSDGMFGGIATISWSYVYMFILFGSFLVVSGAGDFIVTLAQAAAGRTKGGPGFVAVGSSSLMGSVSGSAIANTVATGVITIPLMRRAGFSPRFAAGVEAAASTGGQLMPPVMGAGAFVMANFTGESYLTIVGVALLPAILYFVSVAIFVRIEAHRLNLKDERPFDGSIASTILQGWRHITPIAGLILFLVMGFTPTFAAAMSLGVVVAASWFSTRPMGLPQILEALTLSVKTMTGTAVLLIAIGIVVNVIGTTGLGNTFSLMISSWAGGNLFITLVLIALASLILGMGLPVTASYVVLATLAAPALRDLIIDAQLVSAIAAGQTADTLFATLSLAAPDLAQQIGAPTSMETATAIVAAIPIEMSPMIADAILPVSTVTGGLLAAHMIIFWLSQDSNVTPPVCLTAFAAAGIAGSPPMATGLTAWKLAKGLYIVPVLMAFTPLIWGNWLQALWVFFPAIVGLAAAAAALQGYFEGRLTLILRLAMAGASLALLWPHGIWPISAAGVALFAGVVGLTLRNQIVNAPIIRG